MTVFYHTTQQGLRTGKKGENCGNNTTNKKCKILEKHTYHFKAGDMVKH